MWEDSCPLTCVKQRWADALPRLRGRLWDAGPVPVIPPPGYKASWPAGQRSAQMEMVFDNAHIYPAILVILYLEGNVIPP